MIRASTIKAGDRVVVKGYNRTASRTVLQVGDDYIVVNLCGVVQKVPECKITSHMKV